MGAKNAAATMLRHFFFVNTRRAFGLRSCLGVVTEVAHAGADAGEGGAEVPASTEPRAIDDSDVVLTAKGQRLAKAFAAEFGEQLNAAAEVLSAPQRRRLSVLATQVVLHHAAAQGLDLSTGGRGATR